MTLSLIVGTVVIWIAYDCYAGFTDKQPMITQVMRDSTKRYPLIAFLAGLLAGHFFWNQ